MQTSYELKGIFSPANEKVIYALLPGKYIAVGENNDGVFYKGPAGSTFFAIQQNSNRYDTYDGGFWLPKESSQKVKLFRYYGSVKTFSVSKNKDGSPVNLTQIVDRNNQNQINNQVNGVLVQNITTTSAGRSLSPVGAGIAGAIAGGLVQLIVMQSGKDPHEGQIYFSKPEIDRTLFLKDILLSDQVATAPVSANGLSTSVSQAKTELPLKMTSVVSNTATVSPAPPTTHSTSVTPAPVGPDPESLAGQIGQYSYQTEHLVEAKSCSTAPHAILNGKGTGFESYTLSCDNGDVLAMRCDYGQCRVLK